MRNNIPFILLTVGTLGLCAVTTIIPGAQPVLAILAIVVGASAGIGLGLLVRQPK